MVSFDLLSSLLFLIVLVPLKDDFVTDRESVSKHRSWQACCVCVGKERRVPVTIGRNKTKGQAIHPPSTAFPLLLYSP